MSYSSPGGKFFASSCIVAISRSGGGERVRAGPLEDQQRHRRPLVEIAVGGVVLRRQLDAGDVLEPRHAAVRVGLDDDVAELARLGEPAERLDVELEGALLAAPAAGSARRTPPARSARAAPPRPRRRSCCARRPSPGRARCASSSRARRRCGRRRRRRGAPARPAPAAWRSWRCRAGRASRPGS